MDQLSQMPCQSWMKAKTEKGGWHLSSEGASHPVRQRTAPVVFCRLFVPTAGMPPLVV